MSDIRTLKISLGDYRRALEVEEAYRALDDSRHTFKEDLKRWVELEEKFQNEINDDFDTKEIVLEFERRNR